MCQCYTLKRDILTYIIYSFCIGEPFSDDIENIKEIIEDLNTFEEYCGKYLSNDTQEVFFLWKDELKTIIEKSETTYLSEK